MTKATADVLSKVPAVTLGFWIIKILATTLGETGGDAVSMTMNLGYALASTVFIGIVLIAVLVQIKAKAFHPFLYWTVIVATTTAGTTMADFADRSLGIGYPGGASILLAALLISLAVWYWVEGAISVDTVNSPRVELFYWTSIMFSQTLGTALGDWMADTNGFGFAYGSFVFAGALALVAAAYFFTSISRVILFWAAFILTRPLGATIGDFLDKPVDHGGLDFSRITASLVLIALVVAGILIFPQRADVHPGKAQKWNLRQLLQDKLRRYTFGLAGALAMIAAVFALWRVATHNEGVVEVGTLYRSAQLDPASLQSEIAGNGIKTVINLRGENDQAAWYKAEVALCRKLNIRHVDIRWSAQHLPPPAEVVKLLASYRDVPPPILLHCQSGADRTGLAAALFLIDQRGIPWAQAASQTLTVSHGHFAIYPYFEMDEFVQLYGETAKKSLYDWAREDYPAVYIEEGKETRTEEMLEPFEALFKLHS